MQEWLKSFSIALIKEDLVAIDSLMDTMPDSFETLKEMEQAQVFISQALSLYEAHTSQLKEKMSRLQKAKKYLQ